MKLLTIQPGLAGKIEKKTALGTNQIAGFGGFHPLASLEENKYFSWKTIVLIRIIYLRD